MLVLVLAIAGCFHPTAATGVTCADNGDCPSGQTCDPASNKCTGIAGGSGSIDAPLGGSDGPDGGGSGSDAGITGGCTADSQCASDACLEYTGQCADEANVIYVSAMPSPGNGCTRMQPCQLNNVDMQLSTTRYIIKVPDGTYQNELKISNNHPNVAVVIVSGADLDPAGAVFTNSTALDFNAPVILEGVTVSPQMGNNNDAIHDGVALAAYRIAVTGAGQACIDASNANLAVHDSVLSGAKPKGIFMGGGTAPQKLLVERTVITGNALGGIQMTNGGTATITSSVIAQNGSTSSTTAGIDFSAVDSAKLSFVTIAGNSATATPAGLRSTTATVTLDNSIVVDNVDNGSPQIDAAVVASYTLFPVGEVAAGPTNFAGLARFVGVADYHIQSMSSARNMANPGGVLPADLDGEIRPQGPGPDCGADEVP